MNSEYKDVLLNNKYLRPSANRIQRENHKARAYEITKMCLSCFDDKVYILNNRHDGLALGY